MFTKKIILIMSITIGVLLIFIVALLLWQKYFSGPTLKPIGTTGQGTPSASSTSLEAGLKATQNLINEAKQNVGSANDGSRSQVVLVNRVIDGKKVTDQAVSIAEGTSPISATTGEVLANNGQAAQDSAVQGQGSSPTQSVNVDPAKLPKDTIILAVNPNNTIAPNSFTVHPGQAVSLAFTNQTPWGEIMVFEDPALTAIIFGLMPGATRVMVFNAPTKTGQYLFYSNVSSQRQAGMQGTMIVK